jgi:hypothetical protein
MRIQIFVDTFVQDSTDTTPPPVVEGGVDIVGYTDDGFPIVEATEDGTLHVLRYEPAPRKKRQP